MTCHRSRQTINLAPLRAIFFEIFEKCGLGSRWRERIESILESEAVHLQHVAPSTTESRHFGPVASATRLVFIDAQTVGAVTDCAFFLESTKYARSQTAPYSSLSHYRNSLQSRVSARDYIPNFAGF